MKKFLYFIFSCTIVGLVISLIFASLPVFPYVSKGFLASVSTNRYDQAYSMLSEGFQNRMSLEEFKFNIEKSGLNQYKSVEWMQTVETKDHAHGYVMGIVTTKSGRKIPVQIEYIQIKSNSWMDRGWRIDGLSIPGSDAETPFKGNN